MSPSSLPNLERMEKGDGRWSASAQNREPLPRPAAEHQRPVRLGCKLLFPRPGATSPPRVRTELVRVENLGRAADGPDAARLRVAHSAELFIVTLCDARGGGRSPPPRCALFSGFPFVPPLRCHSYCVPCHQASEATSPESSVRPGVLSPPPPMESCRSGSGRRDGDSGKPCWHLKGLVGSQHLEAVLSNPGDFHDEKKRGPTTPRGGLRVH